MSQKALPENVQEITYIRICKFMTQKRKSLFIPIKVQLITNSSVIPYISETNSTSSSLKKKKKALRRRMGWGRKGKRDGKEKKKEKGKEEEKLKKKENEKKEEKEKEEETIEKAIHEMYRPLRTHSLARR